MNAKTSTAPGTQATWLPGWSAGIALILVLLDRLGLFSLHPLQMLVVIIIAGGAAWLTTVLQADGNTPGWGRVLVHRVVVVVGAGVWVICAGRATSWAGPLTVLLIGAAALTVIGIGCQSPPVKARPVMDPSAGRDRRHKVIREWEAIIRGVTGWSVDVVGWEPWEKNSADGLRLFVELPPDKGVTAEDLAGHALSLAASARLPKGCAVRVDGADRQGVAAVDVMLRNSLADTTGVHVEPSTPASITESFPVLTTPRGEVLSICLRIYSMIIGGTVGSGKTTLLHRIIMWLARCTDSLVWVIDLNGGGVAEPWINPWANDKTSKPVIDWLADNEPEAAAMTAVAIEVARDRKTNREALRRLRNANTTVLPLDAKMPGIVLLTDEGGELRQAASLFGQLAEQRTARLAQIGRAVGVRLIMSVLRGTADLTNKGFRVVAAIRLCLRLDEAGEYEHILDANPGKVDLGGAVGAGFLKTAEISRPVLGRTVNVDLRTIEAHAIACGHLRPDLDEWGLAAAAKVNPYTLMGGRQPAPEFMQLEVMKDAARGEVYTNRWVRYRRKLAEMRGEEYEEEDRDEAQPEAGPVPAGGPAQTGSVIDALAASVFGRPALPALPAVEPAAAEATDAPEVPEVQGGAKIIHLFADRSPAPAQPQPAPASPTSPPTAREQILALVREAGTTGITGNELHRKIGGARSKVFALLTKLGNAGEVKNEAGRYVSAAASPATFG